MKAMSFQKNQAGFLPARIITILLALSLMTAAGCMQSYGRLSSNPVILEHYQTGNLAESYDYYFSGRPGLPDAVVGIDGNYRLKGRLWFKIEPMSQVYDKIRRLSDLNPDATTLRTADILDDQGKKIGVWFSYYYYTAVRIDPETGTVEIMEPYGPGGRSGRAAP
jgi:hypothetical protein